MKFEKTGSGLNAVDDEAMERYASMKLYEIIEFDVPEEPRKKRTKTQNRAIHKYCELLSEALNNAGLEMKAILAEKPEKEIPWSAITIKEIIWREIQKAMFSIESTTDLDTKQVGQVYEVINREIAVKNGIHVPFPSIESIAR